MSSTARNAVSFAEEAPNAEIAENRNPSETENTTIDENATTQPPETNPDFNAAMAKIFPIQPGKTPRRRRSYLAPVCNEH